MLKINRCEYFEMVSPVGLCFYHRAFRSYYGGNPPGLDGWNRYSDAPGKVAVWLSSHEITCADLYSTRDRFPEAK